MPTASSKSAPKRKTPLRAPRTQRATERELIERIEARAAALEYAHTHRREFAPSWYIWQRDFFRSQRDHLQSMLLASNRSGKTFTGSYATACHTTGWYPADWDGLVVDQPVTTWALGVDSSQVRDVIQAELLGTQGPDGVWRDGWIHHDEILDTTRNNAGGIDTAIIANPLGHSELQFKSYSQSSTGQKTLPLAGSSVDIMQVDEQPPDTVVGQLVTRTATGLRGKGGRIAYTMTPELGLTLLVAQFMNERLAHQALVGPIAWSECPHLDPGVQAALLSSYPEHERDMRTKGVPLFGSGRILKLDEQRFLVDPIDINQRPWYRVIRAIDIGIDHPAAGAWLALDPESDTVYVMRTWKQSNGNAANHAAVMNSLWPNAPCVVPPDFDKRDPGSGEAARKFYEAAGLRGAIVFTNDDGQGGDGSRYVEPGLFAMNEALTLDKLKGIRGACDEFVQEARIYHRDEKGKIVKSNDDVTDAIRYGYQMIKRYGVSAATRKVDYGATLRPNLGLRANDSRTLRNPLHGNRSGLR